MRSENNNRTGSGLLGHNIQGVSITVEVRLFNSLHRFGGDGAGTATLSLPAGSAVGDILERLGIPSNKVYLALRNGRDITPSLYSAVNTEAVLDQGDVIALSGPVPYSWGYGAPIV